MVDAGGDAGADARAAAARAWPVAPGAEIPDFGCIGWSRSRGVLACVLGSSFSDSGLESSLEFLRLRTNAERIEPLALLQSRDRSPTAFPPDKIAPFNDSLRGFTPIERGVARIESHWVDDKLVVDPPATVGGMTIMIQLVREGTMIFAPKHRATLWIRFAGQPKVMVDDTADALSHVQARLFVLDGAVIVERIYSVGDEGTYGTFIHLWRCMPDHCVPPSDDEFAMPPRAPAP